jgi:hypothetical protein
MSLPQKLPLDLMQTQWAQQLNPLLLNILTQGVAITGIKLAANTPLVIPTTLSRMQQGWIVTDNTANTPIWRPPGTPFNSTNLTLQSNLATTISLWVF